jgi:hypothetical protein
MEYQPLPPPAAIPPAPADSTESPFVDDWVPPSEELPVEAMEGGGEMPPVEYMPGDEPAACGDAVDESAVGGQILGGRLGHAYDLVFDCLHGPPCYEGALGVERVMHAPFFIDTTQPLKNCRVRFDFAWDQEFPDRAEYFWRKSALVQIDPMTGNAFDEKPFEPSVDYQDIRFMIERGTDQFSVATELPLRIVDPVVRRNTAGFGDMNVTTKTVLLNGRRWQLAHVFRSYFPTGSFRRGTGNGHVSLEPGVAYRYKFSDITCLHGDLKFWFPLGADPIYGGQFLNYGIGISRVAVDRDDFAVIPTLELVAWTVLDGAQTPPSADNNPVGFEPQEIDNMSIVNICPGVRFVWENGNDCGTRELGISSGLALSDDHWYETILRIDLRWSF